MFSQLIRVFRSSKAETPESLADKWAFRGFLILLIFLCLSHALYFSRSKMVASWDEAHYMTGALQISNGIRTGTITGAWNGYRTALGFKAPLICVPASLFMLVTDSPTLPFSLTLISLFAALGMASYSMFRNCFSKFHAAAAASILVSMPLITGLTHRYYVELLVLLLTVIALDLLVRLGWQSMTTALLIGIVAGLGLLAKTTFLALLALPILISLWVEIRGLGDRRAPATRGVLLGRLAASTVTAFAIAWTWYSTNLQAALEHAKIAASATAYYYSHWIAADLSAGPSIIVTLVAVFGLPVILRRVIQRRETTRSSIMWAMILLVALVTACALGMSVAKGTRYQVTWLPAFAALSVAAWYPFKGSKAFRAGPAGLVIIMVILSLHNSFQILPIRPIRFGDIRIIASRFPLNSPNMGDDNSPADPRDYRLSDTEMRIAEDARSRFPPGYSAEARTTQDALLFSHYYFDFISKFRKHSVHYMTWWNHSWTSGPQAADYLIYTKGFRDFYPSDSFFDYYPRIERDVSARRIPYVPLFHLKGPDNSQIVVLVRDVTSLAAIHPERSILLEAEDFQRGTVSVDKAFGSYGEGIGVVVTPKRGGFAEYDFHIPESGKYQVELRYASLVSRPLVVSVDSTVVTKWAAIRETGGFMPQNQHWEPVGTLSLESGAHVLKLQTDDLFPAVDQIAIAPLPKENGPSPSLKKFDVR